jgi:hypothetical protein
MIINFVLKWWPSWISDRNKKKTIFVDGKSLIMLMTFLPTLMTGLVPFLPDMSEKNVEVLK